MLLTDPRFDLAGEAGSGEELLAIVVRDRPDVALVDVRMPGGGTELVSTLRDGHAVVPVVVSSETSPTVAAAMLRAGANDLGGTLMEETISRMAGSEHGSAKTVAELVDIGAGIGRPVRERTTLYGAR